MQFHLSTILWATFLLAASMGMAGVWGAPLTVYLIVVTWHVAGEVNGKKKRLPLGWILVYLALPGIAIALMLPAKASSPSAARRSQCANNLLQIADALDNYRQRWKCLPPTVVRDASGKALHSWRTLILPHLHHADVYETCDMATAWNEGANQSLLGRPVLEYLCPADRTAWDAKSIHTSYVAVVGPGTAWDPAAASPPKSPSASGSKTPAVSAPPRDTRVLVIEILHSTIAWAEPKDLALSEVLAATNEEDSEAGLLRSEHVGGFQVLCADGTVHFLCPPFSRREFTLLLTEGTDAVEAQRESIARELAPRIERLRDLDELEKGRRNARVLLTSLVWLASVTCFGFHVFRLRRCMGEETEETSATAVDHGSS